MATETGSTGSTGSRLLDLPAELRLLVYEKVFEDHKTDLRNSHTYTQHEGRTTWHLYRSKQPGLLLTNKQIYNEALDIFWTSTVVQTDGSVTSGDFPKLFPRSRWAAVKRYEFDPDTAYGRKLRSYQQRVRTPEEEHRVIAKNMRMFGEEELAEKLYVMRDGEGQKKDQ